MRQRGGAASASSLVAITRLTAPSTSYARLVGSKAPLVSFRPTTARTLLWRKKGMIPVLTFITSLTLKHSREGGHWEGLIS